MSGFETGRDLKWKSRALIREESLCTWTVWAQSFMCLKQVSILLKMLILSAISSDAILTLSSDFSMTQRAGTTLCLSMSNGSQQILKTELASSSFLRTIGTRSFETLMDSFHSATRSIIRVSLSINSLNMSSSRSLIACCVLGKIVRKKGKKKKYKQSEMRRQSQLMSY